MKCQILSRSITNLYQTIKRLQITSIFFSQISVKTFQTILERCHLRGSYPNTFYINPTCSEEIITITSTLKPKLSSGHDNVTNKLVKQIIDYIASPLSHIFNLSFSTGVFPADMKMGKVIPLYKSGDDNKFDNYRPISILQSFSKILEKLMYKRLQSYLDRHNILSDNQFGFRKGHSTIHPIITLVKDIIESNDKPTKDLTAAVFLDLSKAFDTVSHEILLNKMEYYGIRGKANLWFKSYLTERYQFTEFKSAISDVSSISSGVPQGSILGPLLFLLYVNDLHNATNLKILSFADDTTVYHSSSNIEDLANTINNELKSIHIWLCENNL